MVRLKRVLAVVVLVLAGAGLLGCSSGSDSDPTSPVFSAFFTPSSTSAASDRVRLASTSSTGNQVLLEVVIDGPTSSTELYSFAFDLMIGDPSVARYVPGSATFGDALTLGSGQGESVLASQVGAQVAVGVSKTSGGSGNGIVAGEATVVSLTFEVLTIGSTTIAFGNPAALDSAGNVVGSVVFDSANGTLSGL